MDFNTLPVLNLHLKSLSDKYLTESSQTKTNLCELDKNMNFWFESFSKSHFWSQWEPKDKYMKIFGRNFNKKSFFTEFFGAIYYEKVIIFGLKRQFARPSCIIIKFSSKNLEWNQLKIRKLVIFIIFLRSIIFYELEVLNQCKNIKMSKHISPH